MTNSLAVIVTLTRKTDTIAACQSLMPQIGQVDELVVIDDGSGEGKSPLITGLCSACASSRVVSYKTPSFFLGSWKPVVDSLASSHVLFLTSDVLLARDYLARVREAISKNPESAMLFGDVITRDDEQRQNDEAIVSLHRISKEQFAQHLSLVANLAGRGGLSAAYKVSSFLNTGGFRVELDAGNYLLPFILTGLSGDVVHVERTGNVCLQDELLVSSYGSTSPYRCLDDLARIHHIVREKQPADGVAVIDRWYDAVRVEYIERHVDMLNRRLIGANKTVDSYTPQFSMVGRIVSRFMQVSLGLIRRLLSGRVRYAALNYHPDTECFGWIKPSFSFGVNWKNFIKKSFNQERLGIAKRDILAFFDMDSFAGRTCIDIGCGSGIHSLAMIQAGAGKLFSFDYDIESVSATKRLYEREGKPSHWQVTQGSILDENFVGSVPKADIVYSWGVLHHTGKMWPAIKAASTMVKDGGLFYIAIYTKWTGSDDAVRLKIKYNRAGWLGKRRMELCLMRQGIPGWSYIFKDFSHYRQQVSAKLRLIREYKEMRGMSFYHDIVDWLGGYPYEDATVEEVIWFCEKHCGLTLVKVNATGGNICSDYLFRRPAAHG